MLIKTARNHPQLFSNSYIKLSGMLIIQTGNVAAVQNKYCVHYKYCTENFSFKVFQCKVLGFFVLTQRRKAHMMTKTLIEFSFRENVHI